ncbi:hypothetical protein UlMin_038808 [Ulmus minor]
MALLGDDGRGYELAGKLEAAGVWRAWLGDSTYASFLHYLNSSNTWEAFMRVDESKSRAQIQIQLRVRALLFDKASVSLFLRPNPSSSSSSSSSVAVSKLNPNYLQLHGDDVYYTLDNSSPDGVPSNTALPKIQSKAAFGIGSRYGEFEIDNMPQRYRNEEFPETWYDQFIEKYRINRPYKLSPGDRELNKRSPEEMSTYLTLLEKHKRRRVAFKEDQHLGYGNTVLENSAHMRPNSILDGSNSHDDNSPFFPEIMFTLNCVPDCAIPATNQAENKQKIDFNGVLDTLPRVMTRSPVMIERFGIRPDYLSMEHGGSLYQGKNGAGVNKKCLSQDQASQFSQKVIARMLTTLGFEGASEVPIEVFSQLMSCHIRELGRTLKVLSDSYRKQCSAIELLKMFLQTSKCDFRSLVEHVKDGSRNVVQQGQQQPVHGMQSQMPMQHQSPLRMTQISRQMQAQIQQMVNPGNLAFQQQQFERIRRHQPTTPRSSTEMDKERSPLVPVKLENASPDFPVDGNSFNNFNNRHPQMQLRHRPQMAAISSLAMPNIHGQPGNQFRQMPSMQMPQMQTQNVSVVRAPPVKVEGFQELMGGDASSKHDSEENRLTSPASK